MQPRNWTDTDQHLESQWIDQHPEAERIDQGGVVSNLGRWL